MSDQAFRSWNQKAPWLNEREAWPAALFPEASWHYFRDAGCLVTSLAVMLRLFGLEKEQDPALINPWILNERLIKAGAFTPAADLIIRDISKLYPIEYAGQFPYSREAFLRLWEAEEPFLITVPGVLEPKHFIVPDGTEGGVLKIIDPAGGKIFLGEFDDVIDLRVFRRQ